MRSTLLALALGVPVLAIPPENFGFPSAPNDTILSVTYMNNGAPFLLAPGQLFGVDVPANAPLISLNTPVYASLQTPQYTQYVVVMVDPDASYPEAPQNRFILHYLQANLTKSNTDTFSTTALGGTQLVNSSAPVVAYRRPRPPTNSSAHRYILYAFQQPSINFQIPSAYGQIAQGNISRFNLTDFIQVANLGTPVAANYFYCSNMTQVPPTFVAAPGATYPGGNGMMITSGSATGTAASASVTMTNSASATGSASGSASSGAAIATSRALAEKVVPLAGEGVGLVTALGMLLSWFI